jgi:hypothetical protein
MDPVNISGLEGVVVDGEYDQDNGYKIISTAFGLHGNTGCGAPVLKIVNSRQGSNLQDLFATDIGKLQKEIFDATSIIIVLNNELHSILTTLLPRAQAKKAVLFSSIFGMEPKKFFCTGECKTFGPTATEMLTVHVACDIQNFLLNSKIFSAWMNYTTGDY